MCIDITEYVFHIFSLYHTFMILLVLAKFDLDNFFGHPKDETLLQNQKTNATFFFLPGKLDDTQYMLHGIMETEELMFSQ